MKYPVKSILLSAAVALFAFFAVLQVSCKKDSNGGSVFTNKCAAIACAHNGVCNNGVCTCPAGYEGNNCEIVTSSRYTKQWNVIETGTISGPNKFPLIIIADTNATTVWIQNLYNYFQSMRATVKGDTITIPNQDLQGKVVFGKGYYISDVTSSSYGEIVMQYEVIDTATNVVDDFGVNTAIDHSSASIWK